MTTLRCVVVVLMICAILPLPGDALVFCSYLGGIEPPCSAYWKADAVFAGVVHDITKAPREADDHFDMLWVHFSVEEAYRGVEGTDVQVATVTGTSCDTKFQVGEKWLVYAKRKATTGRLGISVRTTGHAYANEDLSYIRSVAEGVNEASIMGRVFKNNRPWEGVRVEVEGNGVKYQETTDKEGWVRLPSLKPGRYLIRGLFPGQTGLTGLAGDREPSRLREGRRSTLVEYEEDLTPGRCRYVQFLMMGE